MRHNTDIFTSPEQKLVIVADAHLPLDGRPGAELRLKRFNALLDKHQQDTAVWVLLGDIFDFWYEWIHVVPKRAFPLLHRLRSLVDQGAQVHLFAGNHDFRITGFLEKEVGLTVHLDEWAATVDGRRIFFHHGDGMASKDVGYRRMKWVFRKSWMQQIFGTIIHPDLAMKIANLASRKGYKKKERSIEERRPILAQYEKRARRILSNGFDLVVFGHTHNAANIHYPEGWYHNPGSFDDDYAYSVIEGGLPQGRRLK